MQEWEDASSQELSRWLGAGCSKGSHLLQGLEVGGSQELGADAFLPPVAAVPFLVSLHAGHPCTKADT